MNIYHVDTDVAYGMVFAENDDETRERWKRGLGTPGLNVSITLNFVRDRQSRFLPVDCANESYHSGDGFLLNARARVALAPLLSTCGEYIPATLADHDYQWFNCTAWCDIADVDRIEGELDRSYPGDSFLAGKITRWAFHPDRLHDLPAVFRVPQKPITWLFCTDLFKTEVENSDLLGFEFIHVWSSEHGGTELPRNPFTEFFGSNAKAWGERVDAKRAMARARLGLKPERKRRRRRKQAPQSTEPETPAP